MNKNLGQLDNENNVLLYSVIGAGLLLTWSLSKKLRDGLLSLGPPIPAIPSIPSIPPISPIDGTSTLPCEFVLGPRGLSVPTAAGGPIGKGEFVDLLQKCRRMRKIVRMRILPGTDPQTTIYVTDIMRRVGIRWEVV